MDLDDGGSSQEGDDVVRGWPLRGRGAAAVFGENLSEPGRLSLSGPCLRRLLRCS